jgi:hypothetical protein
MYALNLDYEDYYLLKTEGSWPKVAWIEMLVSSYLLDAPT